MKNKNKNFGFGLIEVVVGAAIVSISMIGMVSLLNKSLEVSRSTGKKIQADFLLNEGVEALRVMRDSSWNNIGNLSTSTEYHLIFSAGNWSTTTENIFIDKKFERKFYVSDVYRDSGDNISSGGFYDSGTKKVTAIVSWVDRGATTSESVSTYFANIF